MELLARRWFVAVRLLLTSSEIEPMKRKISMLWLYPIGYFALICLIPWWKHKEFLPRLANMTTKGEPQ